ncbi:MAG: DUF559 domain-containing protein [Gloeocapsa sp. DLM2.Bin57]|nr:MAG: DUF559 domain-containing protein [Gloeocapsa sp. DLM2.Bin57]
MSSHPLLKYIRKDCYPYLALPQEIYLHLQGPKLPEKPSLAPEPKKPEKPTPPELPSIPTRVMGKLKSAVSAGAGSIVLLAIIAAEAPFFLIAVGTAGVGLLLKFLYDSFTYEERMRDYRENTLPKYNQEKQKYDHKLKEWKNKCLQIEQEYQKEKEKATQEYERKVEKLKKQWENGLSLIINSYPSNLDVNSQARVGKLDMSLRDAIENKLNNLIDIEVTLMPDNKGLSIPGYDYPYTPDIPLKVISKINNQELFIDIEIDEPWFINKYQEKETCHTLGDNKQLNRDSFFNDNGWVVIRFSEKQVDQEIDQCVDFIFNVSRMIFQPKHRLCNQPPKDHQRWNSDTALDESRPIK